MIDSGNFRPSAPAAHTKLHRSLVRGVGTPKGNQKEHTGGSKENDTPSSTQGIFKGVVQGGGFLWLGVVLVPTLLHGIGVRCQIPVPSCASSFLESSGRSPTSFKVSITVASADFSETSVCGARLLFGVGTPVLLPIGLKGNQRDKQCLFFLGGGESEQK